MNSVKRKANKGFTLAETLIVVAIVLALAAVAFIAVYNYQRSMYQLEFDGIAREIFFAAQNHLTQADSQGLVEQKTEGQAGTKAENYYNHNTEGESGSSYADVYYYAFPTDSGSGDDMLSLMLPDMAVDINSSLGGGSFFILYQKSTATVLDVFYSVKQNSRFAHNYTPGDYPKLLGLRGDENKQARRNVDGAVYGYYGGEDAQSERLTIKAPELKVENAEKLKVILTNTNEASGDKSILDKLTIQLIITGKTSTAEKTINVLKNKGITGDTQTYDIENPDSTYKDYEIYLDDITKTSGHFAERFQTSDNGKFFIPGEDLEIRAKIFSTNAYANIAWSASATTNSLFADPYTASSNPVLGSDVKNGTAAIANFRHFENLDAKVSRLDHNDLDDKLDINKAAQTTDLNWNTFLENTDKDKTKIFPLGADSTKEGCAYPVTPQTYGVDYTANKLAYDGQGHSASNVKVDHSGDAGLFGTFGESGSEVDESGNEIKNLKLIDFEITGTTSAGALAGAVTNTTITNVVAHNSEDNDSKFDNDDTTAGKKPNVTATGAAGGLIGSMSGGSVTKSAAAVYVKGGTEAGGLIGSVTGDNNTVTACYSGGHTISGKPDGAEPKYDGHADVYPVRYDPDHCNVTAASGTAGGLIGNAGTATISNSYSTCSASGTKAGGFIGTGGSATNCYCTGLVFGTDTEGAFAASDTSADNSCKYFEIINERRNKDGSGNPASGYHYLKAFGNDTDGESGKEVGKIDDTVADYGTFVGASTAWDLAEPYNSKLTDYYGDNFNLKTVFQIPLTEKSKTTGEDAKLFVATHYGDWPAPEEFIFN